MEATIDMEFVEGVGPESIVKGLALVANGGVIQTFLFRPPYPMHAHGSEENGLNWDDGLIPYDQFHTVLTEVTAPFDHLYAFGTRQCEILNRHTKIPVHNLEDLQCPDPSKLTSDVRCYLSCYKFPHLRCATKNAYAAHSWLVFYLQKKVHIVCPKDKRRHCRI